MGNDHHRLFLVTGITGLSILGVSTFVQDLL
jgi:hypothetical protein